jgi:hypothetical protein
MDIYSISFNNNSFPDSLTAYYEYRKILKKFKNNYKLFEIHYFNDLNNYGNNYIKFTRKPEIEIPSNIKEVIYEKGVKILYTDI